MRSRVTVRRNVVAALARSRRALVDVQDQLDRLLAEIRSHTSSLDPDAPDRLNRATAEVRAALGIALRT